MKKRGIVMPITNNEDSVWVSPERARHYFWNHKKNVQGISLGTMMNRIYSCKLNGRVRFDDYKGWQVKISIQIFDTNKVA